MSQVKDRWLLEMIILSEASQKDRQISHDIAYIYSLKKDTNKHMLLLLLSRFSYVRHCDPMDGSPPGSPIPGILQARTLEWVPISFSNARMHAKSLQSCPTLCNPMDSSPPGSPIHRILQARIHIQNRNKPTDIEHKIMVNKGKNAE